MPPTLRPLVALAKVSVTTAFSLSRKRIVVPLGASEYLGSSEPRRQRLGLTSTDEIVAGTVSVAPPPPPPPPTPAGLTVMLTVAGALSDVPSLPLNVDESLP